MHMHIDICLRSRQLKPLPNLFELFVKQNSNTFLFDLKQFSEITIVREHKRVWVVWRSEITPLFVGNLVVIWIQECAIIMQVSWRYLIHWCAHDCFVWLFS